jgi:hypothetical protein
MPRQFPQLDIEKVPSVGTDPSIGLQAFIAKHFQL